MLRARRMEKSPVSKENEQEPDSINKLHDQLLCSIISLLPGREAVATSALSHRWRTLWKNVPRLDLDITQLTKSWASEDQKQRKRSILIMDRVIASQRSKVTRCHIGHMLNDWKSGLLIKWIKHLTVKRGLEELSLTMHKQRRSLSYKIPRRLFGGIHVLELNAYDLVTTSLHVQDCQELETLRLFSVVLTEKFLLDIISNCTSLENLLLKSCEGLKCIKIDDSRLKSLEITDMKIEQLDLRMEALTILKIENIQLGNNIKVVTCCPALRVLQVHASQPLSVRDFLERWCSIFKQEAGPYDWAGNLRHLSITLDLNNLFANTVLAYIIRQLSRLKKLSIINKVDSVSAASNSRYLLSYPENTFWDRREAPDSIVHSLRWVHIRGCTGQEREIRFASHLLKNASKLEELLIQFDADIFKEDIRTAICSLKVPRSSLNISIVFKHGNEYLEKEYSNLMEEGDLCKALRETVTLSLQSEVPSHQGCQN